MDWRLNKLTITNFKFFCKEFVLPVDCKNLLIYGENGSGKSSIYWSLYTILQSCFKPGITVASKYFDSTNSENLRNRFSDNPYSGIRIEFKHSDGRIKIFENSIDTTNTLGTTDHFIRLTAAASGFMNYKFLAALFEFKNSEKNDIFPIFEKEIFPFLNFSKSYALIDGDNYTQTQTAEGWWRYIIRCHNDEAILPHSRSKKANFLENTHQYKQFKDLISDFNSEMINILRQIIHRVNEKIVQVFGLPIELSYVYEKVDFNRVKPGTKKSKDGKIHKPEIILTASLNHKVIKDKRPIHHPKSFFNEAKLTIVALALRLSIYEMMISNMPDCAEMLIIDDLLISLDMCNRMKIIDVILNYYRKGKQLLIFTHDRALYNLIREKIEKEPNWNCFELYSKYEGYYDDAIPVPVLLKHDNYIEQAHKHIKGFDFPAAANALRKACESILKKLLPDNWLYSVDVNGSYQKLNLHGMISQSLKLNNYYDVNLSLNNLDSFRERILNPFSHDDLRTPLYRGELMLLLKEVEQLEAIEKVELIGQNSIGKDSFIFELPNEMGVLSAQIIFLERFSILKYQGRVYYSNSDIRVFCCNLPSMNNNVMKIRRFLKNMFSRAKIDPTNAYEYVYDPRLNKTIKEIADSINIR